MSKPHLLAFRIVVAIGLIAGFSTINPGAVPIARAGPVPPITPTPATSPVQPDRPNAPEATITVQSAADTGTPNAANCPSASCRLRDAIAAAASGDTINFAGNFTINLAGSELAISKNLTIDGSGHTIIINGPGAGCATCFRVFDITAGTVTLNQLTISNGNCNNCHGGGVYNAGALAATSDTFSSNIADFGGGVFNAGTLNVTGSTFTGNRAGTSPTSGGGGGILSQSILTLVNSTVSNNVGNNGINYGSGGGLQVENGTATLANVTITNNSASGTGDDGGGAIMIYGGTVNISNSTIAGNTTASSTGAAGVSIYQYVATASVTLKNTIVQSAAGKDCTLRGGTLAANSNNLANDNTCGSATQATNAQIHLGPLASNGGSTQTMALGIDSVAIDAGDAATCAATPVSSLDQRGQPRNDLQCDVGAFELEYADSPTVQRPVSSAAVTTFGPALMGIQRAAGFTNPGVITVTRYSASTHGTQAIAAAWAITPTTTSGLSLTLKLCYTPSELGSLTESNLRFWLRSGSTWVQVGGAPALSTVGGNHCAQISGITTGGIWTLATNTPTAVILNSFTATQAGDHNAIAWETVSELHNLGFNLWRGTSVSGPLVKLNDYLIPSQAPGGTEGFAYSYNDTDIVSETIYYYWLEDVDLNGTVTRHGPVQAIVPEGTVPTAVTLTTLRANSHTTDLLGLVLAGLLGIAATLVMLKRRRAE